MSSSFRCRPPIIEGAQTPQADRNEAKTLNIFLQELIAFVAFFLYGSYFEWFFHKYLFHSPKYIRRTFNAHTLTHHQVYKGDHTYSVAPHPEPEHVAMDWWSLFAFLGVHAPLIGLVQWATGWHCFWGGMAAIGGYYGIYEYFHWCMHVPNQRPFERWRVYRFIREHHRLHHVHMQKNLNVILPLADLTLGTFKRETKRAEVPARNSVAAKSPASGTEISAAAIRRAQRARRAKANPPAG